MQKTRKNKLADIYEVYKTVRVGERPERKAKDGSIPTHPVVSVADLSEADVKTDCIKWLKRHRVFHDSHACGRRGNILFGIKHSGDIHGILPSSLGRTAGKHFEIECKRGGGGTLSKGQQDRMADVRAAGGEYWVIHGIEELVYYMGGFGMSLRECLRCGRLFKPEYEDHTLCDDECEEFYIGVPIEDEGELV